MATLDGRWYDGTGSRARPVRLECDGATLHVHEGDVVHAFALATVQPTPRLGRMARQLRLPGQGHVEVADDPLLDAWFPKRHRIEKAADRLERHRTAALVAGLGTVLGVVFFFQVGLPWMADKVAPLVPKAMEDTIGEQAMAILDRTHLAPSRLPAARRAALETQFVDLVAELPRRADYKLGFRNAPEIGPNAFALPNGQIIVTDQLVKLVERDDELLAILAHEAGHHEHRHGMRRALASSAVVVVAGFLFGDLSGTASLSVSIPTLLLESGFSRDYEREADAFAFSLLRAKGGTPDSFAGAMRKLTDHYGGDDDVGVIGYLATHPPSRERIDAAVAAAEGLPAREPDPSDARDDEGDEEDEGKPVPRIGDKDARKAGTD